MADLLESTEDGITTLTLNRPERLNALSPDMTAGLREALERLATDRTAEAPKANFGEYPSVLKNSPAGRARDLHPS